MNAARTALAPPLVAPGRRTLRWALAAGAVAVLAGLGWAALAPIQPPPASAREALFEIPKGTYARRMAGERLEILPDTLHLQLLVKDVLLLRNRDDVPQIFGPVLIMPGQSFRLPFEKASTYSFACSAHASGQLAVVVAPAPEPGWQRLRWRAGRWLGSGA
jgi:hypothetical protein